MAVVHQLQVKILRNTGKYSITRYTLPRSFGININMIFYARIINNTTHKLLKNNKTSEVHMPPIHPPRLRKIS